MSDSEENLFTDSQLFDSQMTEDINDEEVEDQGFSQLSNNEDNNENVSSNAKRTELNRSSMNGLSGNKTNVKSLVRTSLSEETKRIYNDKYQKTYLKTKEAENVRDICESAKLLSEQMDKQNQYFKSGGVNENMPLDAKCISTNSAIALQLVKRLQTDSKQFDSMEFAQKLLTALNPSVDDENETHLKVDQMDWIELGRKYCRFHKVVPTFHFIHGSFDSTLNEVKPKQTKPRAKKPVLSGVTQATQIDPKSKANDDSTPQEVELILKTVKKLEAKNDCLPYIPVIVNPKSISQTVENIFHSTFLIKDGMARIVADEEDGGPVLQSIDNSEVDVTNDDKGIQSVFSFTMNDWKYWIKKFDIKNAAIKHPKK